MAITSTLAIQFSNEQARLSADAMAQAYNAAVDVAVRWAALGSGAAALAQMQTQIRQAAIKILAAYQLVYWTEKVWFSGLNASFPNDSTAVNDNGTGSAPDPNRPALTGAIVNNVITRCVEFQNWLLSATQSFTDSARNSVAALNTVLAIRYGVLPIGLTDAGNFVNRCTELKTNYEANANQNLGTILAAAVNPSSQLGS